MRLSRHQIEYMHKEWTEKQSAIASIESTYREMSNNLAELEAELDSKEGIERSELVYGREVGGCSEGA